MNSFGILLTELHEGSIILENARADAFRSEYSGEIGGQCKFFIPGGNRLIGALKSAQPSKVVIELLDSAPAPPRVEIRLFAGSCRPQTAKKLMALATEMGLRELHFVRLSGSERSYLSSPLFNPDQLQRELHKAQQQAWDPNAPDVLVHPSFDYCKERILGQPSSGTVRILGSATGSPISSMRADESSASYTNVDLFVGPEGGFASEEIGVLRTLGFVPISLGERHLRVEHATALLLGQILACVMTDRFG